MPEPLHLPELVERLRNVNYNTSKSELLRLCRATAEAITPTSDVVAGAERFIRQTFADQALLDSDANTGEFIAETPLDDVLPALALTFATWRAAAQSAVAGEDTKDSDSGLMFDRFLGREPRSFPDLDTEFQAVGGDALRDILLRGGSPLAIEIPSSGLHQKVIHNGAELCDTCVNIFGIRMLWAGAVNTSEHSMSDWTSAGAVDRAARALNSAGWTCGGGTHEPGEYDTCAQCRGVCQEQARAVFSAARAVS